MHQADHAQGHENALQGQKGKGEVGVEGLVEEIEQDVAADGGEGEGELDYVLPICPVFLFKTYFNKNMGDGMRMLNEKYGLKSMVTNAEKDAK
ncbi:MAG: hypothetical protein ACE5FD_14000 [Anaerolineae bacterium]